MLIFLYPLFNLGSNNIQKNIKEDEIDQYGKNVKNDQTIENGKSMNQKLDSRTCPGSKYMDAAIIPIELSKFFENSDKGMETKSNHNSPNSTNMIHPSYKKEKFDTKSDYQEVSITLHCFREKTENLNKKSRRNFEKSPFVAKKSKSNKYDGKWSRNKDMIAKFEPKQDLGILIYNTITYKYLSLLQNLIINPYILASKILKMRALLKKKVKTVFLRIEKHDYTNTDANFLFLNFVKFNVETFFRPREENVGDSFLDKYQLLEEFKFMPAIFCDFFYIFGGLYDSGQSESFKIIYDIAIIDEFRNSIRSCLKQMLTIINAYDSILDLEYSKACKFVSKNYEPYGDYQPFSIDLMNRFYYKIARLGFLEILKMYKDKIITEYYEYSIRAFHYTFHSPRSHLIMCRNCFFFIFVIFHEKLLKDRIVSLKNAYISKNVDFNIGLSVKPILMAKFINSPNLKMNLLCNINRIINNFSSFYLLKMPQKYIFSMDHNANLLRITVDDTDIYTITHSHAINYLYVLNVYLCIESFNINKNIDF